MRAAVVPAVTASVVAAAAWRARALVPGGQGRWDRTNHRGEILSMLEGPCWAAGALAGLAVAGAVPARVRAGAAVAALGASAFGVVDDLAERGSDKGLRGHLGALRHGRVTTGGLKVVGIGLTGLASAALLLRTGGPGSRTSAAVDVAVSGAVVAGAANVANLLDLRPGRVLKVVGLAAPSLAAGFSSDHSQGRTAAAAIAGAAVGASAALAGPDLHEKAMLGDGGANCAGALLGAALVARTAHRGSSGRAARAGALAALAGLTLASERVSFTRVIESTPGLRELDALGRRTAEQPR